MSSKHKKGTSFSAGSFFFMLKILS